MIQSKVVLFNLFLLLAFNACHRKSCVKEKDAVVKNVIVNAELNKSETGDSYQIDSINIDEDILSVFVNYSGGCKEHSFELYNNGAYAKSLPPQTSVTLKHDGHGDSCRELVSQQVKFNLSPLKYNGQNTVIIHVGENHKIRYSY